MRFNPATESTVRTIESLPAEVRDRLLALPPYYNEPFSVWDCQDGRGWVPNRANPQMEHIMTFFESRSLVLK